MIIPADNLENVVGLIGTMVNNTVIQGARWGLYIYVCPKNQPRCSNPQYALSIVFRAQQSGLYVEFDAGPFYVTNPPILSFKYPIQSTDNNIQIDVTFQGSTITVYGNGQQILSVNMLEEFSTIRQLSSSSWYFTSGGQQITVPPNYLNYLSFLLNVTTPINLSSLLNQFIPLIVIAPLLALLPKILGGVSTFRRQRQTNTQSNPPPGGQQNPV